MSKIEKEEPNEISKSKQKKDMLELQKVGETLLSLSETQLAKLPLPDNLRESLHLARALKSHEAKRRQLQYIGKLMRNLDPEPIVSALNLIQTSHDQDTAGFHEVEKWRDQLISEGDIALQNFSRIYPLADRQHLRQLTRNAQHDLANNKNSGAKTALFKYLRDLLKK